MRKMKKLIISSIAFEKEVDYYLSYNDIYVCDGEANSLKDIVQDVTKTMSLRFIAMERRQR